MKQGTVLFYIELPTIQPTLMKKPKDENLHHAHNKLFKAAGKEEGIKGGEARGQVNKSKTQVTRLLLRGILSIPEIADVINVPVTFVVEVRDTLVSRDNVLPAFLRDFKI